MKLHSPYTFNGKAPIREINRQTSKESLPLKCMDLYSNQGYFHNTLRRLDRQFFNEGFFYVKTFNDKVKLSKPDDCETTLKSGYAPIDAFDVFACTPPPGVYALFKSCNLIFKYYQGLQATSPCVIGSTSRLVDRWGGR